MGLPPHIARRNWLPPLTLLTALAFAAVLGYLASRAVPSTEAVRLRNSFLAAEGSSGDFDWRPPEWPTGFLRQAGPAPGIFVAAAARVPSQGPALERAIALIRNLDAGPEHGGPIQRSTVETYRTIIARGGGYCADYTQVLNGLAWAAGIAVREWGVSFDGFGGFGHAFNEIYDPDLGKWVMLDPFYGFYVRDVASGAPLSAIEFRDRLRLDQPLQSMRVVRLVPRAYDFSTDGKMLAFYRRGVDQFYLWWGNNVFDYDGQPLVRTAGSISRATEQAAAILTGVHPGIRILPTAGNARMVEDLMRTRDTVLVLLTVGALLAVLLLAEVLAGRRARRAAEAA